VNRIIRAVAVGAAASLLVVGCSQDEPRPKMAPTPSARPSASASPSAEPPPSNTPEPLGPEETVRAWIGARNEAIGNGESSKVLALTSSKCKSCRDLLNPFLKLYERGGSVTTTGWKVEKANRKPDFATTREVLAAVQFGDGTTVTHEGADPTYFAAEKHIMQFLLAGSIAGWSVDQIVFLS